MGYRPAWMAAGPEQSIDRNFPNRDVHTVAANSKPADTVSLPNLHFRHPRLQITTTRFVTSLLVSGPPRITIIGIFEAHEATGYTKCIQLENTFACLL